MQTEFAKADQPLKQKRFTKKTKRLASMIAFGSCCGFLLGHPGCLTPGNLPRPPGLSLASAPQIKSLSNIHGEYL